MPDFFRGVPAAETKMASNGGESYDHHRGSAPLLRPTSPARFWTFMSINVACFVAVNAFWQYLCTGRWLDCSLGSYCHALARPPGEMLLRPLDIFSYPWMIGVAGLLLGLVVLTPVIISVLYRLRWGLLLAVVVAVVGQAPFLALVAAGGCLLAARTPLRSDMPFVATFLGLGPLAAYLLLLGFSGLDMAAVLPLKRWVLRLPLLVAIVSALISAAVVLSLARLTRFRPGVVWPVLLVLLAAPAAVFYCNIGPAGLDYALIAGDLAGGEAVFEPVSLAKWRTRKGAAGLSGQALQTRLAEDLKDRRKALVKRCRRFLDRYPTSGQAASVSWIEAHCLCLQLDVQALAAERVRCVAFYPLEQSAQAWQELRQRYGDSPQSALAEWRIGELALRGGKVKEADELLRRSAERLRKLVGPADRAIGERPGELFSEPVILPSKSYYAEVLFEAERLVWLIDQNKLLSDERSASAMAKYLSVNLYALPAEEHYRQLCVLAGKYEDTELSENLKLAVARATADVNERVNLLVALADQRGDCDAAIEANYELGQLLVQQSLLRLRPDVEKPEVYLKRVVDAPPNPYRSKAAECMAWLRTSAAALKGP